VVFENIILVLSGILTALVTGLYFGYSVSVNWGLHRLNDSDYVKAMQSLNAAIQNPHILCELLWPSPIVTFGNISTKRHKSESICSTFSFLGSIHRKFIRSYDGGKYSFKPTACKV
jgi:hypothetical protein